MPMPSGRGTDDEVSADPSGEVVRLIESLMPPGRRVDYVRWQPSPDLTYFTSYIRLDASPEEFTGLVRRLRLNRPGEGDADRYLPAAWSVAPGVRLDWWDADPDTPPDAAARAFGSNGWIVAKHEHARAYLIVTDTGHAEGTPGPA